MFFLLFFLACSQKDLSSESGDSSSLDNLPEVSIDASSAATEPGGTLTISGILEYVAFDVDDPDLALFMGLLSYTTEGTYLFYEVFSYTSLPENNQIQYTLTELSQGNYTLTAGAILGEEGSIYFPAIGDIWGYYNGTVENPIFEENKSAQVELSTSAENIDFGVAFLPDPAFQ